MKLIKKFNELHRDVRNVIILFSSTFFIITFFLGVISANNNDSDACIVRKPIEVLTTFPLFLGCQLGQDKFELKLN